MAHTSKQSAHEHPLHLQWNPALQSPREYGREPRYYSPHTFSYQKPLLIQRPC